MERLKIEVPKGPRVFRLAYASRASTKVRRPTVIRLAADAATHNLKSGISGVLFSRNGIFLQWLEGPADEVCALMSRISADRRHRDVSILSAGWIPARRFSRWPMQLADASLAPVAIHPAAKPLGITPFDAECAMIAFDRAAQDYRYQSQEPSLYACEPIRFAEDLVRCEPAQLPGLPARAQVSLRARAHLVDDVCAAFAGAWQDDVWSSAEIAIGLAHLNCLWQRAGRAPEPLCARSQTAVVVPPGSGEILGAIVKADLLRTAGFGVKMVLEPDLKTSIAALSRVACKTVVVAGPRVGLAGDIKRADSFAEIVRQRFPDLAVHLGGRVSGSLCDWPERLAWRRDATGALPASSVEWLAMSALATVPTERRTTLKRKSAEARPSLH